jgi:peptide/nickel transport system substrate-binding protein
MSLPSTVVERYVIRMSPRPASVWGDFADRAKTLFEGGGSLQDPEGGKLVDEFNQFRPDNYVASGPFVVDTNTLTSARFDLVKNETGYLADEVGFDRIVIFNGRADVVAPMVLEGEVDYATHGFPPASEQQMIKEGIRIVRPPIYSGPAIYINYARHGDTLGDPKVRQAIAHAIDRVQNGIVALADSGVGVEMMAGFSDNHVPQWLTEDAIAALNRYAFDREKAAVLLEEAGWTKDGDVWTMSNGEPARFELSHTAEFQDWTSAATDAAEQLMDFGIEIRLLGVTAAQIADEVNRGNFDLAIQGWGNSTNPHPHFSFAQALFTYNTIPQAQGEPGMSYDLVQQTEVAGEIDLEELTLKSAQGLDEAKQREQVTTIAQVFNELLPVIPLWERYGNNPVNEGQRVASWPTDDNPIYQNSVYADGIPTMLMLTGDLEAAE